MTARTLGTLVTIAAFAGIASTQRPGGAARDTTRAAQQDSAQGAKQAAPQAATLRREVFSYSGAGRRDPMVSLMNSSDLRPLVTEVEVLGIVYDEEGTDHVAVLRNTVDSKTLYRVKTGQTLGRMRVVQITRREVVVAIEEFGFSRQERLPAKPDTSAKRAP